MGTQDSGTCDSRLLKSGVYLLYVAYRINIYTVLECDIGHVLPFLLPRGNLEKLGVGKYT